MSTGRAYAGSIALTPGYSSSDRPDQKCQYKFRQQYVQVSICSSMMQKETWSPTWSSCFSLIFHNNQLLSLNIGLYFDIGLSPYLWNCRQISTSTIWTWHNNECCHNLMKLAHKVSDRHHHHHKYQWWTAMTTHSDNHNRKKKTVILEVVPATPKNVWNTSTASSGRSDIPPFSESCPHKQWHSLGSEVQILAYC